MTVTEVRSRIVNPTRFREEEERGYTRQGSSETGNAATLGASTLTLHKTSRWLGRQSLSKGTLIEWRRIK